jgi:lysophospholipase L1-like esterase
MKAVANPSACFTGHISRLVFPLLAMMALATVAKAQLPLDTRIIYLGDSITADPTMSSYALWGLWYSQGRYYSVSGWNQGVGGNTSGDMLARINATTTRIIPGRTVVVVLGGANPEASPSVTTANLRTIYNCIEAAGGKVVGIPQTPYATGSSSTVTTVDQFVQSQPDITVVDDSGYDPKTMLQDNVHPNMKGGDYLGEQVAATLDTLISGSSILDVTANNLHPNSTFAGTNAGSGSNWSGTYCNAMTVAVSGTNGAASGAAWTLSKATMADGRPAQQCSVTNSPDENTITLSFDCPINGKTGDLFEGWAELEVSGTGLMGYYLNHAGGIEVPAWVVWWARPCALPRSPIVLRTSPSPLLVPTSTTPWTLGVHVAPGASLTFKVAAAMSRKVTDAGVSAPLITGTATASATVGSSFSFQITATNRPTSYNATGMPAGLSINTNNGVITGTPTASGTDYVTLMAINASGTGAGTLTLKANPSGGNAKVP